MILKQEINTGFFLFHLINFIHMTKHIKKNTYYFVNILSWKLTLAKAEKTLLHIVSMLSMQNGMRNKYLLRRISYMCVTLHNTCLNYFPIAYIFISVIKNFMVF